jgi:hypothetical protein
MSVDMYIRVHICSAAVEVVYYLGSINVCMYESIYMYTYTYRHSVAVVAVNKLLQLLYYLRYIYMLQ